MNDKLTSVTLIFCLVFTSGCEITFKRKTKPEEKQDKAVVMEKKISEDKMEKNSSMAKRPASALKVLFSKKDADLITVYYTSEENAIIRRNMIRHSAVNKEQQKQIQVGKIIPRDFQVIPLPLKLERALSTLDLRYIRVQLGANIILMNVKTRQILDIIKI